MNKVICVIVARMENVGKIMEVTRKYSCNSYWGLFFGTSRMTAYFNKTGWPEKAPKTDEERKDFVAALHKRKTELFMALIEKKLLPLRPGVARLVNSLNCCLVFVSSAYFWLSSWKWNWDFWYLLNWWFVKDYTFSSFFNFCYVDKVRHVVLCT